MLLLVFGHFTCLLGVAGVWGLLTRLVGLERLGVAGVRGLGLAGVRGLGLAGVRGLGLAGVWGLRTRLVVLTFGFLTRK